MLFNYTFERNWHHVAIWRDASRYALRLKKLEYTNTYTLRNKNSQIINAHKAEP